MVDIVKSMADYINEQVVKIDVGKLSSPSNDAYRVGVGTKQLQEAGEQATSEGSDDGINSSGSPHQEPRNHTGFPKSYGVV
jgi:hypothetical protein